MSKAGVWGEFLLGIGLITVGLSQAFWVGQNRIRAFLGRIVARSRVMCVRAVEDPRVRLFPAWLIVVRVADDDGLVSDVLLRGAVTFKAEAATSNARVVARHLGIPHCVEGDADAHEMA